MKTIFCYGDSNTYGFDPRAYLGGRLEYSRRWTGILDGTPMWSILNQGENGREIPSCRADYQALNACLSAHSELDAVLILLGTNDLLQNVPVSTALERMDNLLRFLTVHPSVESKSVLLTAPPPVKQPGDHFFDEFSSFSSECRILAERHRIDFADSGKWQIELAFDGVHFSESGHRTFARQTDLWLRRIFPDKAAEIYQ